MADTEKNIWVNVLVEKELADKLDEMVREQRPASDRSKFIRWLIEKEYEDRQHTRHGKETFRKALAGQHQVHKPRAAVRQ